MTVRLNSFMDLNAWKQAHQLSLLIYEATRRFPDKEKFGLISQIRRASVSVTSNLAEGFGRRTPADKSYRYRIAISSLYEVQSQLLISRDIGYLTQEKFLEAISIATHTAKLTNRLIRTIEERTLAPNP